MGPRGHCSYPSTARAKAATATSSTFAKARSCSRRSAGRCRPRPRPLTRGLKAEVSHAGPRHRSAARPRVTSADLCICGHAAALHPDRECIVRSCRCRVFTSTVQLRGRVGILAGELRPNQRMRRLPAPRRRPVRGDVPGAVRCARPDLHRPPLRDRDEEGLGSVRGRPQLRSERRRRQSARLQGRIRVWGAHDQMAARQVTT
jgi:hypothetical protein